MKKASKKQKPGRTKGISVTEKPTKRSSRKYPALDPSVNLKSRIDLIDYDYVDKLSEKDKEYLNKFTEEYIIASFKKGKKRLHTKKEHEKDAYDRNNARNRCIYTKSKAHGNLNYLEDLKESMKDDIIEVEDELIDKIDSDELINEVNNFNESGNDSDGSSDDSDKL